jgi:5-methylcytosine-specific restriction endonuclease McrA
MSAAFIASPEFLQTPDWKRARYMALKMNDGRCECCGRSKHDGVKLHVDHIKPRKTHPHLALDVRNLQVLDEDCNLAKGNVDKTDWRHPSHPHRR